MSRILCAFLVCLFAGTAELCSGSENEDLFKLVVPVDWQRFADPPPVDDDYRLSVDMLLNTARYNVQWAVGAANRIEADWRELSGREPHDVIRPACEAAYALAVVLKTGIFDERIVGVSQAETLARTVQLIHAAAVAHDGNSWKYPWQSSFWAAALGNAAWFLWDDLDMQTKRLVVEIVVFEADRFLTPEYRVPYWNGRGGDTKAEENAWDSMIFHVASAMMPEHSHVARWKEICSKLMVSAYARKQDMQDETVLDGKPVSQWLDGYNVREDGVVLNHGFFHPDYMTCVSLKLRVYLTQSLIGGPVPETADYRAADVYRLFVTRKWPSPPHEPPGGTIYVPGQAEVYYPKGTDWFTGRVVIYHRLDNIAHVLGWDSDLTGPPARDWMRLRAKRILQRQQKHDDRRIYGPGEFTRHPPREQDAAWLIADAFLLQWLRAHGGISRKGNWLAAHGDGREEP